tara:strand:- start:1323 stop:1901 length:579 start_codon:yes stop_codon:yes gene_type:complete
MGIVRSFTIERCNREEIKDFVETYHYSKSINGLNSSYCFKLLREGKIIGAIIYGKPAMPSIWKVYAQAPEELIELRRLCCIDDTPKNTESYFVGRTLRWLKRNTEIKKVVSYADPNFGHAGIIYRATNFTYIGRTAKCKMIVFNGKRYHPKAIFSKHKGKLKPYALRLRYALLLGLAVRITQEGKHIYLYSF